MTFSVPSVRFPAQIAALASEFLLRREYKYQLDYILVRDEKAQNTNGGTFTSGAWRTRDLNTEVVDTGNFATVASNQITLLPGTYRFSCSAPGHFCANHQVKLYNISTGADIAAGTSEIISSGSHQTRSFVSGRFTITGSTVVELQHRCITSRSTDGLGLAANLTTEVYAVCEFWRE